MRLPTRTRPLSRGDEAERESVRHLQELYTVAVGLALTIGVERVMPAEGQGRVQLHVSLVFMGFVATLVPFYHGAQRHLDHMYQFRPHQPQRGRGLFFGDFMFLFVEACLLIAMGASAENPTRFLVIWLILLSLDVIWIFAFVQFSNRLDDREGSQFGWHEYGWAVVNVPAIVVGGVVLEILYRGNLTETGAAALLLLLTLARTSADYGFNWDTYFPNILPAPEPVPTPAGAPGAD